MKYVTLINNEQYEIEILKDGSLLVNGQPRTVDFMALGPSLYSLISNTNSLQVVVEGEQTNYSVLVKGRLFETQVLDERALMMAQRKGGLGGGSGELNAPMPGLIVAVPVEVGQQVVQGQTLIILESMKMQNELKSPITGTVQTVHVEPGKTVDKNAPLISVLPAEE
ncbi:MAG: acetyl-CoA carboxylase biotin carboxyl carrier protein subunit [Anaerolineae bacterium]